MGKRFPSEGAAAPRPPAREASGERRRVGAVAARALEDIYAVVFRSRPEGVRAWSDGTALLVVMRLAEAGEPLESAALDALPALVATAVLARTGWQLAAGRATVEDGLGLVLLVYVLPEEAPTTRPPYDAELGLGAHAERRAPEHVPSWRNWTPVPVGGGVPEREAPHPPRHLRLVDD